MESFFFGGGFEIMFFLMFGLFLVVFVGALFKGIGQWNKNNHSPRLTVEAAVVSRRSAHTSHHTSTHAMHHTTTYYVTFEVESGDRLELNVSGSEYGMLAEGDRGKLSFQGTRYLGFVRE